MSSVDVAIVRPNVEAAPKDYELPGSQELAPLAVRALLDGTGAGTAFQPALQLLSPGGQVLWTAVTSDTVAAGASADVSWFPRVGGGAAAAQASALPWAIATQAVYVAADYFLGRSPDPLSFRDFHGNDATAFKFVATGSPTAGDGDVQILRDGLYLARLVVSARLRAAGSDPGYTWDMAAYARGEDAAARIFFGPDLFTAAVVVQPVGSYAFYLSPRDNFGSPNGNSMLARREQHVATESWLNLPDPDVTWPVTVKAQFRHGLNDADVTTAPDYNLWLMRYGDGNSAAPDP